jgi:hypothetical protein
MQIRVEYTAKLEQVYGNHMQIFIDGSLKRKRVEYAVITPESTITERMRQHTTIISVEHQAVIKAIYFAKKKKKPTLIATESLSTRMAIFGTSGK